MCVLYCIRGQTCVLYYYCIYANVEDGMRRPLFAMRSERPIRDNVFQRNTLLVSKILPFKSPAAPTDPPFRMEPFWYFRGVCLNRWIDHRPATTPIQLLLLLLLLNRNLKVVSGWNTCRPLLPDSVGHNFTAGRLTDTKTCRRVRWRCLEKDLPHFCFCKVTLEGVCLWKNNYIKST